jgi:phage tail-like protein
VAEPALSISYRCTVDGFINLGVWTKIEGLSFEYDVLPYREGGVNTHMLSIVGPVKYSNVRLTKPVDRDSMLVAGWLAANLVKIVPQTMAITAMDSSGGEIVTWNLAGVVPIKWSGPSLDIMGNQIATETLELAYEQIIGLGMGGTVIAGGLTIAGNLGF